MDVFFNTYRLYTKEGQVIRARREPDGSILFADFSRQCDGRIKKPMIEDSTEYGFVDRVMNAYDRGTYERDKGSWEFLMLEGRPKGEPKSYKR